MLRFIIRTKNKMAEFFCACKTSLNVLEFGATKFAGIKAGKIYAPVVQWIEQRFPVPLIGVRVPAGVLIAK